jgi:MFS family permease
VNRARWRRIRAIQRLRALRWRRKVIQAGYTTGLVFFITGCITGTWVSRLPAIKDAVGIGDAQLAVAFLSLEAAAIAGLQVGGVLVPRLASRASLRWALPLFTAVLVLVGVAPNLLALSLSLAALALANSVVDVAMNASGVAVQQTLDRPVMSRLHAMHSLGGLAGAGLGALAAWAGIGTAAHFLVVGLVATAAALLAGPRLLPPVIEQEPRGADLVVTAEERPAGGDNGGEATRTRPGWRSGWTRTLLTAALVAFCLSFADGAANNWSAIYLRDTLGSGAALAATAVAVLLAAQTIGRLAGDRLVARFGPRRILRLGAAVAGTGFGGSLLIAHPAAGIVGIALLGLGLSVTVPVTLSAAGGETGVPTSVAVSRVATLGYAGSFIAPAAIGAVAGLSGLSVALFLPAVLLLLAAAAAVLLGPISATGRRLTPEAAP